MRTLLFAAALAAVTSTSLGAQLYTPDPRTPLISSSGSGEVNRAPDYAVITIGLLAKGSSPGGTASELDRLLATVRDTLRVHGLKDSAVVSGTRRIEPQRTYPARDITGYTGGISLKVTLRDLATLGSLLDALAAAGATEIPEVRFKSNDEEGAYDEALGKAVAEATRRATSAARAAGGRLGAIVMIEPESRYFGHFGPEEYVRMESPQAQNASATARASVTIYWRYEGR